MSDDELIEAMWAEMKRVGELLAADNGAPAHDVMRAALAVVRAHDRDGERYRWLRDHMWSQHMTGRYYLPIAWEADADKRSAGNNMDAAIDAAIAAEGEGMSDLLLANLRTIGTHHCDGEVGKEAADEIERLRAVLAVERKLRERAEAEAARLRAAIERAAHSPACSSVGYMMPCNCWKRAALEAER